MKRAIVVTVLLCFAIVCASQTPKNKGISKQNGALNTAPANKTENEQQDTANPPNQTIAIYNQSSPAEHGGDNKHSQDAIDVERKLTNFTGYLVIVGLLQVVILAVQAVLFFQQKNIMKQHKVSLEELATAASDNATAANQNADFSRINAEATEKNAAAAQTSAEAYMVSQRAQLIAVAVTQDAIQDFIVGRKPVVAMEIKNNGFTPAYHCLYETWIEVLDTPFPDFTQTADHYRVPFPMTIYPSNPIPLIIHIGLERRLTDADYVDFSKGKKSLCFRIRIEYEDAFKRRRWCEFGYEYTGQRFGALPKYNDAN